MASRPVKTRPERPAPRTSAGWCLELTDHSLLRTRAEGLFAGASGARSQREAAGLATQFLRLNRAIFEQMEISAAAEFEGPDLYVSISSAGTVGAAPLVSPLTARYDHGVVIQPRFEWPGLGPILAETGWRVVPQPMPWPLLKRSARKVPRWVLSLLVLARLKALLDALERRFSMSEQTRGAPRGRIRWEQYVSRHMPRAGFLQVPCVFPDLQEDAELRAAIRYCLDLEVRSLETQRGHGGFIHQLIGWADQMRRRVQDAPARAPSPLTLDQWLRRPLRSEPLVEGIQAIRWTVEEKGLAGLSDLEGIPWRMPMELFFEAWVETVLGHVSRQTGGKLKAGRLRETVTPLEWERPYAGSQRSLVPDLWLEWEGRSLIVDAKYKRHWDELEHTPWGSWEEAARQEHRNDLLQVLAYGNLAGAPDVVVCLAYPCRARTWESLRDRRRLFLKARLPVSGRRLSLWLTAVPMCPPAEAVAAPWIEQLRRWAAGEGAD